MEVLYLTGALMEHFLDQSAQFRRLTQMKQSNKYKSSIPIKSIGKLYQNYI